MFNKRQFQQISLLLAAGMTLGLGTACAEWAWNSQAQIDVLDAMQTKPLEVSVSASDSTYYGWAPGKRLSVRAYVEKPDGTKTWLRDGRGHRSWKLVLDEKGEGRVLVVPSKEAYTGPLNVLVNGRDWPSDAGDFSVEKTLSYRFADGAGIRVHYMDQTLERYGTPSDFPRQVLDAAVLGYQTITDFEGFGSQGYSFAHPDESYAQDPDRTVDIYIGDPMDGTAFAGRGFNARYFKDAPCFDTVDRGDRRYDAVILLPANYSDFIRNWEKINPSSLGRRNLEVDLRGTLVHEMLHVVLFYYNRNLGKSAGGEHEGAASKHLDWYVEGLARYFETFVGARHDFFSQGFKQTLPDKVRFSRGGSNYFMRYPDQAFTGLRYENAIFWRYLDSRFGMTAIEKLSRLMREDSGIPQQLEAALGVPFDELLDQFALSILMKDFGLKDDAGYLNDVARTRLLFSDGQFYLVDGNGGTQALGKVCRTDWVGQWGTSRAAFGEPSAGGDSTPESDVSAWATDHYEILVDGSLPVLRIAQTDTPARLTAQLVVRTRGGSTIHRTASIAGRRADAFDVPQVLRSEGLDASDAETVYLLITNHDSSRAARYEILAS